MVSLIQDFEADFLWKVSLKILNSGILLKTFIHTYAQNPSLNVHAALYSEATDLKFSSCFHPIPFFVCASSKGSNKTAVMSHCNSNTMEINLCHGHYKDQNLNAG